MKLNACAHAGPRKHLPPQEPLPKHPAVLLVLCLVIPALRKGRRNISQCSWHFVLHIPALCKAAGPAFPQAGKLLPLLKQAAHNAHAAPQLFAAKPAFVPPGTAAKSSFAHRLPGSCRLPARGPGPATHPPLSKSPSAPGQAAAQGVPGLGCKNRGNTPLPAAGVTASRQTLPQGPPAAPARQAGAFSARTPAQCPFWGGWPGGAG